MKSSDVVRFQQLDVELEDARKAGNLVRMQQLLAEKTSLRASIYGRPRETASP